MCKSLTYDIYSISTNEFCFRTKYDIIYDTYFLDKTAYLPNRLQELFPKLSLWEFGFDRFMLNKGIQDSKIANTLIYILSSFLDSDKIVYSRVYNPVGRHDVLNRLYIQSFRKYAKSFIPFSIDVHTISGAEFILIAYYPRLSNMSIESFFECMGSTLSYCFEEDPICTIKVYNSLTLAHVDLSLIQ